MALVLRFSTGAPASSRGGGGPLGRMRALAVPRPRCGHGRARRARWRWSEERVPTGEARRVKTIGPAGVCYLEARSAMAPSLPGTVSAILLGVLVTQDRAYAGPGRGAAPASVAVSAAPQTPGGMPLPALGLLICGTATIIIGAAMGGGALAAAQQLSAGPRFDPDLYRHGQSLEAAAIALDVIGPLLVGAGVTWASVSYVRRRRLDGVALRAGPWQGGVGIALTGRF